MDSKKTTHAGFSLTELLIAVAIFGILIAIVIPSYKTYVTRSNRSDAETVLLQAAQAMERNFTANDTYLTNNGTTLTIQNLDGNPGPWQQSPVTGTAIYTMAIDPSTTSTYYKLKATPVPTGINRYDGFLTIDSSGVKSWDKNNSGAIDTGENTWNP